MSDYNSPIAHYRLNEWTISNLGLKTLQDQERVLQEIVDEVRFYPYFALPALLYPFVMLLAPVCISVPRLFFSIPCCLSILLCMLLMLMQVNDHGVLIVRSHRIAAQEAFSSDPDLRISVSSGHTKKEIEKSATTIRTAIARVLSRRR